MKTTEEAAKSHEFNRDLNGISSLINKSTISSFKAGVRFAEEWISVDDELPEINKEPYEIFVRTYQNKHDVLTIVDDFEIKVLKEHFTHWRPINRK